MDNEDSEIGSDPMNLYSGSSSRMFANEKLAETDKTRRKLESDHASLPKGVKGLITELQDLLDRSKAENDSFSSYLRTMFIEGKPQPKPEDINVEFRARELNLQLINRIQSCLKRYKTPR